MLKSFNPADIYIRCKVCKHTYPRKDYPTNHRVCKSCVIKLNMHIPKRRGRRPKNMQLN